MSSAQQVVNNIMVQSYNASVNLITNKNDPFTASQYLLTVLSQIPQGSVEINMDKLIEEQPEPKSFVEDPEQEDYDSEMWDYWRKLQLMVPRAVAQWAMSQREEKQVK